MSQTQTQPVYVGGPKDGEKVPPVMAVGQRILLPTLSARRRHGYVRQDDATYRYIGEVDVA